MTYTLLVPNTHGNPRVGGVTNNTYRPVNVGILKDVDPTDVASLIAGGALVALNNADTPATLTNTQTLTNKTLTSPVLNSPTTTGPAPVTAGATLAATGYNPGNTILLTTAAGSVVTLPAATGTGNKYYFIVKTTTTSGAHKILAASTSDFLSGIVTGFNSTTTLMFASGSATNHSLQMPYTGSQPSGGFIGDYFTFTDVAANLWHVSGMFQAGTSPTTPFSSADS